MGFKEQIWALLEQMEPPQTSGEDAKPPDTQQVHTKTSEDIKAPMDMPKVQLPITATMEPSTVEPAKIIAPPVPDDVVVVTSDDMVKESLDMRLASFYSQQKNLEESVKMLSSEVLLIKQGIETIEAAIEVQAKISPTAEKLSDLINLI